MVNYSFVPESWHFEEFFTFQQTAMIFSGVSVSVLPYPAERCDPVRPAGSGGPRHIPAGSQGGRGTSPRLTWTQGAHPRDLMPARTDAGPCLPDRSLWGGKDRKGQLFSQNNLVAFVWLLCLIVAQIRRAIIYSMQTVDLDISLYLLIVTVMQCKILVNVYVFKIFMSIYIYVYMYTYHQWCSIPQAGASSDRVLGGC